MGHYVSLAVWTFLLTFLVLTIGYRRINARLIKQARVRKVRPGDLVEPVFVYGELVQPQQDVAEQ